MELSTHEALMAPFNEKQISWRVGATSRDGKKAIALAYIDARDVMKRLDDVVGIEGWQCEYPFAGCCRIGIFLDNAWVWKSNGAGETKVEGEKGQYSDAFKRAGVMWGISRYLYALPNVWVPLDQYKRLAETPKLPEWATPEGYLKILESKGK